MLGYINLYIICLRLVYFILTASIVLYYLNISSYLLGRRRVAANLRARYAVFRTLADLTVF
jgi:hypothetical protein